MGVLSTRSELYHDCGQDRPGSGWFRREVDGLAAAGKGANGRLAGRPGELAVPSRLRSL